jgi:hypothetical protein
MVVAPEHTGITIGADVDVRTTVAARAHFVDDGRERSDEYEHHPQRK